MLPLSLAHTHTHTGSLGQSHSEPDFVLAFFPFTNKTSHWISIRKRSQPNESIFFCFHRRRHHHHHLASFSRIFGRNMCIRVCTRFLHKGFNLLSNALFQKKKCEIDFNVVIKNEMESYNLNA